MKFINGIFYLVLFIGFVLPSNASFYIPIFGAFISIKEIAFILLPLVNSFCSSKNGSFILDKRLKNYILFFFAAILLAEGLKVIIYNQSFPDMVKSLRIGLPLFSSLLLLFQGIKADIRKVWRTLLWAISFSVIIALLSLFVYLPIYYDLSQHQSILAQNNGRIMNSNASFGIIGLYLLFQNKTKWYNKGKLVFMTSLLSIAALVLTFNRTLLALLILLFFYLLLKDFKWKRLRKSITAGTLMLFVFFSAYAASPLIHRQIDMRFFRITDGETTISKQTINDNRDFMYKGAVERIEQGYWKIGLPYDVPFFNQYSIEKGKIVKHSKMDISLINILLRHGIIALLIFLSIFIRILRKHYLPMIIGIIFLLASLNIDALYNHNTILFIILFISVGISESFNKGVNYNY